MSLTHDRSWAPLIHDSTTHELVEGQNSVMTRCMSICKLSLIPIVDEEDDVQ